MLQAIIGVLIGMGVFYILVDLYKVPYYKTSQAVDNISQKQKHKTSFLDAHLGSIARWLSGKIKMDKFKKAQLESDLKTAQMEITPEMFKANAIVKASLIGVFAIPEMGRFYRHVLIENGFPHHGAVAFGHYGKALFEVFKLLGAEKIGYNRPKNDRYETENPF